MIFPIEPRSNPEKNFFAYWEDFLTDDDINYILALPDWHNTASAEIGDAGNGRVEERIRKTKIFWFVPNQNNAHIWQKLSNATAEVNRRFFNFDIKGFFEPAQLGLYTAEDRAHYTWHTDDGIKNDRVPRKLSVVLSLSDPSEFEGGELQVKVGSDEPKTLELKKGRAWFFPSYVLHRVTPVTKGIRRSLVLWSGGPDFK